MLKDYIHKLYADETRDFDDEVLRDRLAHQLGLHQPGLSCPKINLHASRPMRSTRWMPLAFGGAFAVFVFALVLTRLPSAGPVGPGPIVYGVKTDDWVYDNSRASDSSQSVSNFGSAAGLSSGGGFLSSLSLSDSASVSSIAAPEASRALGYSVGGAKDANAFRDDIANGYTPLPTDLTYEGLFYEYYFDTGEKEACVDLFCPSYTTAVSPDPISGEIDYYVSVGLNSGLTEDDFAREPLNLVLVLDISGSMGSAFDTYYYDQGVGVWDDQEDVRKTKMEVAQEAMIDLLGHLKPEDRVGIVLFDDEAVVAKDLRLVGETDMDAINQHIREVSPQGGTDMSAGMDLGTSLLDDVSSEGYENRIILLTDAQPNTGDLSESGMRGRMETNAGNHIYSTFIGIGVDFQSELVEAITKTEGANYYAVHSPEEFRTRMDEGFDFMVTPLVFDLQLEADADGFDIEQVYGSPEADKATGEIMYVNTLFPSLTQDGETKGGVVLLKLKKTSDDPELALRVSYKDREGKSYTSEATVKFDSMVEHYDNTGVQKAVWLARYADLLKDWMIDTRKETHWWAEDRSLVNEEEGITVPPDVIGSKWEQTSVPLAVSEQYKQYIDAFRDAFQEEIASIGDTTLEREVQILETLKNAP